MIEDYRSAQRAGQRAYRANVARGQSPYLAVLDDILTDVDIVAQEPLGLVDIPAGSSGKVIIKNAENFMQSAMQSHRLQNRQRVRQSMLRWNHAVIMARHRRVRKRL